MLYGDSAGACSGESENLFGVYPALLDHHSFQTETLLCPRERQKRHIDALIPENPLSKCDSSRLGHDDLGNGIRTNHVMRRTLFFSFWSVEGPQKFASALTVYVTSFFATYLLPTYDRRGHTMKCRRARTILAEFRRTMASTRKDATEVEHDCFCSSWLSPPLWSLCLLLTVGHDRQWSARHFALHRGTSTQERKRKKGRKKKKNRSIVPPATLLPNFHPLILPS